jgi:Na+-driven multidrug efflux pump
LKIGLPVAVLNFTATLSFILLAFIVNVFAEAGVPEAHAQAIAARYNGFAVLPSRAMASAVAAIAAQNYGADKPERNKKTYLAGLFICLGLGLILWALTFFFPELVLKAFGGVGETVAAGKIYMKIMSFDYLLLPAGVIAYGLVEGAGKNVGNYDDKRYRLPRYPRPRRISVIGCFQNENDGRRDLDSPCVLDLRDFDLGLYIYQKKKGVKYFN